MTLCLNPACSTRNAPDTQFCIKCGTKLLIQDRYKPSRELGNGAFGKTFLAVDLGKPSQPQCVIKQFIFTSLNPALVQKAKDLFYEEAKQLEKLGNHDQIPQLFGYHEQENRLYLIQEFVDGENLLDELDREGAFSEAKVRLVLADLLPVLEFIHSHKVIHRDIKPENIMRRRSDQKLVLIDFGAVKQTTATSLQRTGTTIGSPAYQAPEQGKGYATFSSDIYSFGVSCLQLLTNMEPFDLYDAHEGKYVWRHFLVDNSVQDSLGKVLDKMTEGLARDRYSSAQEVLQALNPPTAKVSVPVPAPIPTPIPNPLKAQIPPRYRQLEALLAAGQWREADQETAQMMLAVTNRIEEGWLDVASIDNFPCEDLRAIDGLWVKYSNGRFGFSVQKRIYQSLGGRGYNEQVWESFGDRVGWIKGGRWLNYKDITFNNKAPEGHLPSPPLWGLDYRGTKGFLGWWGGWGGEKMNGLCWGFRGEWVGGKYIIYRVWNGWGISSLASRLVKCSI